MGQNQNLYASYGGYGIKQTIVSGSCRHEYFKGDNQTIYSYGMACIKRSTVKQLRRYIRYLVSSGLIQKFDQAMGNSPTHYKLPVSFNEHSNHVAYMTRERPKPLENKPSNNPGLIIKDCIDDEDVIGLDEE